MENNNKRENVSNSLIANLFDQIKDKTVAEGMEITEENMAKTIGIPTEEFHSFLIGENKDRERLINIIMKLAAAYNVKKTTIEITKEITITRRIFRDNSEIEGRD